MLDPGTTPTPAPTSPSSPTVAAPTIDLQSHCGGRGETTEESMRAFEKSLDLGVTTLEFDIVITADGVPAVWRDPVVMPEKCADTAAATPNDPKFPYVGKLMHELTWAQVQTLDCGKLLANFPDAIGEGIACGECDTVEFKSSARVNMRTGEKDERMELVIAKTVAAFLNSEGGTLLIGVADHGEMLGLTADYGTPCASPTATVSSCGCVTSSTPGSGRTRPRCRRRGSRPTPRGRRLPAHLPRSPRPVYLRPGKANTPPELWVRVGSSTRQLPVDDAVTYVVHHWPFAVKAPVGSQLRALLGPRFASNEKTR